LVGGIRWADDDLGTQLGQAGLTVFGASLTSLNPVLGFFFSVFRTLFVKEDTDARKGMLKEIFDHVQTMIDSSLHEFWNKLVQGKLYELTSDIAHAYEAEQVEEQAKAWDKVQDKFKEAAKWVFGDCYELDTIRGISDPPPSAKCDRFRLKTGGIKALLLELEFTDLMFATQTELLRLKIKSNITEIAMRSSRLAFGHAQRWKEYRLETLEKNKNSKDFKGSVSLLNSRSCGAILGRDAATKKSFDKISTLCKEEIDSRHGSFNFHGCNAAQDLVNMCRTAAVKAIEEGTEELLDRATEQKKNICAQFDGFSKNSLAKNICLWRATPAVQPPAPCDTATVFIKTHGGNFVTNTNGRLRSAPVPYGHGRHFTWKLVDTGADPSRWNNYDEQEVFIRSMQDDKNLEDRNGRVGLSTDTGSYQKWKLQPTGDKDGKVFIKSHRGVYLQWGAGNDKFGLSKNRLSHEKWTLETSNVRKTACNFLNY